MILLLYHDSLNGQSIAGQSYMNYSCIISHTTECLKCMLPTKNFFHFGRFIIFTNRTKSYLKSSVELLFCLDFLLTDENFFECLIFYSKLYKNYDDNNMNVDNEIYTNLILTF